jgi:hypothetical protein
MDSKLRTYVIIGGAVAAAAIIIGVVALSGGFDMSKTKMTEQQTIPEETVTFKEEQPLGPSTDMNDVKTDSQLYKINTDCELLYAMTLSEYPNGERLHNLTLSGVVSKYQDEFEPWRAIFFHEDKIREFIDQGFTPEFLYAFANAIMLEYSINPELRPVVLLAVDPKTQPDIMNKIFADENCQKYFAVRTGIQNTQP